MRLKLLAAYDDPGGGLAVTSVVRKIYERGIAEVVAYSGKPSMNFLDDTGVKVNELRSDLKRVEAVSIIENEMPDILLTATGGGTGEQELRNVANEKHISSFVILDFWKHYTRRWKYANYELSEMKENVLVMDENVKAEMIREGFPENRILVTGHPYLDVVFNGEKKESNETGNGDCFLFLSQPSDTIELEYQNIHPVASVVAALKNYSIRENKKLTLYVKLHPLEKMSRELSEISKDADESEIEIIYKGAKDELVDLLNKCNTVIGYNSIALFEAVACGKRVFSLDVVPMTESLKAAMLEAGIEMIKPSELLSSLSSGSDTKSIEAKKHYRGAIENCISQILAATKIQQSKVL